jgi:hypothetical protein
MFGSPVMASCVGRWMYHKTASLLQQVICGTCLIMYSDFVPALWFRTLRLNFRHRGTTFSVFPDAFKHG